MLMAFPENLLGQLVLEHVVKNFNIAPVTCPTAKTSLHWFQKCQKRQRAMPPTATPKTARQEAAARKSVFRPVLDSPFHEPW